MSVPGVLMWPIFPTLMQHRCLFPICTFLDWHHDVCIQAPQSASLPQLTASAARSAGSKPITPSQLASCMSALGLLSQPFCSGRLQQPSAGPALCCWWIPWTLAPGGSWPPWGLDGAGDGSHSGRAREPLPARHLPAGQASRRSCALRRCGSQTAPTCVGVPWFTFASA